MLKCNQHLVFKCLAKGFKTTTDRGNVAAPQPFLRLALAQLLDMFILNKSLYLSLPCVENKMDGSGQMAPRHEYLPLLQRTRIQFLELTWQLTSLCNPPGNLMPSSGLPRAPSIHVRYTHTCRQSTLTHNIKINKPFLKIRCWIKQSPTVALKLYRSPRFCSQPWSSRDTRLTKNYDLHIVCIHGTLKN